MNRRPGEYDEDDEDDFPVKAPKLIQPRRKEKAAAKPPELVTQPCEKCAKPYKVLASEAHWRTLCHPCYLARRNAEQEAQRARTAELAKAQPDRGEAKALLEKQQLQMRQLEQRQKQQRRLAARGFPSTSLARNRASP